MTHHVPAELEADIRRTMDRLSDGLAAIAAKLDPARLSRQAQYAVARRLVRVVREQPVPAVMAALGLAFLLGRDGRAAARGRLLGAVGATVGGAVLSAVLSRREQRKLFRD